MRLGIGLSALVFMVALTASAPVSAGVFACSDQHLSYAAPCRPSSSTLEFAARSRPRVTIHPRRIYPGPNAKRYCRSWLAKEYRVSGPVIVPQMHCWWQ